METGTKISLTAHGVLIGLALFGGPLFDSDDSHAIQISEVSIVTSSEFEAMMSASPAPVLEVPKQSLPTLVEEMDAAAAPVEDTAPETPEVPEVETPPTPDETPDLNALSEPQQPALVVESPNLTEQANDSVGTTLVVPDSPVLGQETDGLREPDQLALLQPQPRPAPRIDTTEAPKPETDAAIAEQVTQSTTPDATATEQAEEAEEAAPEESATQIVSDPVEDPNSAAPVKSSRPRGRPTDIAAKAQKAKDEADKLVAAATAKAQKEAEAKAIEEALLQATSDVAPSAPAGPPLTSSEKNGLVLAVQQCWNVPVGLQNASDLVVVLAVELTPDGALVSSPTLIEPSGTPQGTTRQAFEAGRRALIRCAPYDLPRDKYEQWRQLEVVFNPKKMVVK